MGLETKEIVPIPEARIIIEDEKHAVVALRIDKAWLSRNIRFLAELADRATEETSVPCA